MQAATAELEAPRSIINTCIAAMSISGTQRSCADGGLDPLQDFVHEHRRAARAGKDIEALPELRDRPGIAPRVIACWPVLSQLRAAFPSIPASAQCRARMSGCVSMTSGNCPSGVVAMRSCNFWRRLRNSVPRAASCIRACLKVYSAPGARRAGKSIPRARVARGRRRLVASPFLQRR
jgi:hypothetical protein